MIRKLLRITSILCLLLFIFAGVFLYSIYVAVDRVNITYHTLASEKIPTSMVDKTIAFISDIKYNNYMNKERLTNMIEKFNKSGADIVIFGGDLFSETEKNPPDSQDVAEVTEILSSIDAPLGKFAVLGEDDLVNETTKQIVDDVLFNSGFEIITNRAITLRNHENVGISLIGLDSEINGSPQPDDAFASVSEEAFNIMVTHCPDTVKRNDINIQYLDAIISGHSLGGQIYMPFIGSVLRREGAKTYSHGYYNISGKQLYVSNGLGTQEYDMRLFAPPQILIFRLLQQNEAK